MMAYLRRLFTHVDQSAQLDRAIAEHRQAVSESLETTRKVSKISRDIVKDTKVTLDIVNRAFQDRQSLR